jgi:DHA2 family multidrug resistance protein-like MFS transporter
MDVSVLYFAVPSISQDLEPTATQQLWIFDVYGFVLAGLLITMGSLGDRIGRRRLLLLGAAAFGITSAAAAYAGSAEALIAARALLGVGGATLMPSTLALIRTMFQDAKQRATAVTIWTATLAAGISIGPIISGLLLQHFWWGSVFLVNIPFMVLLLVAGPIFLPEYRKAGPSNFDFVSSILSFAAVLPAIYGIKEMAAHGFSWSRAAYIAAGVVMSALFLRRQRARTDPMIDLTLFRSRDFSAALTTNVIGTFALIGFAIFTTQFLQSVLGMSPLKAALWCLVPSVGVGVAAPIASTLAKKGVNRAYLIAAGFCIAAAGFLGVLAVGVHTSIWVLLLAAGSYAAGLVVVMSLSNELIMGAVPIDRAGSASAISETGSELGGAIGMAVLGSIGTAVYRANLSTDVPAVARETLGGALAIGDPTLVAAARDAFTQGMHAAAIGAAVVMALAAGVALLSRDTPNAALEAVASGDREPVNAAV